MKPIEAALAALPAEEVEELDAWDLQETELIDLDSDGSLPLGEDR